MKKLKILYEGLSSNIGGIETYIHSLYRNMNYNIFEVSFLIDKGLKIAFEDEYKKDNVKFFEIENRKNNYRQYLKDLKEVYENNDFDFIHINVMSYSLFERITYACKYSKAKVIVHSHNGGYTNGLYRTRLLNQLGKIMVKKYNFFKVACSEKAGNYMFGKSSFDIFNNGIDFERFKYSIKNRKLIRKKLNISEDEFVIGNVASLFPVKNHQFLLEVFKCLSDKYKKCRLVLVGEGPLEGDIINQAKKLEIYDKILFLGKRMDVNKIYSSFDIYVMPSFSEGISISLCEAQINGLKCYTSDGVDRNSDISGNVNFISLERLASEWADYIYKNNNVRDFEVNNKIQKEYDLKKSCEKVFQFYLKNMK